MTIKAELKLQATGDASVVVYDNLGIVDIEFGKEARIELNLAQAKELGRQLYEEGLY